MSPARLLVFLAVILVLSACRPDPGAIGRETGTASQTTEDPSSPNETEPAIGDPEESFAEELRRCKIVNNSLIRNAENVIYKALFQTQYYLRLKISDDVSVSPRVELRVDPSIGENTYLIEKTLFGVLIRVSSGAGVESAAKELQQFINESGETVMSGYSVIGLGSFSVRSYDEVSAKASQMYFSVDAERSPISYAVGDEIAFWISFWADDEIISCPKLSWTAYTDDGKQYSGSGSGATGQLEVCIPATGTGFVRVKCSAMNEWDQLLSGVDQENMFGFGVEVASIGTGWTEPSDFDLFWAGQIASLDGVSPDLLSLDRLSPVSGFEVYRLKIACPEDCGFAAAYITYPQGAKPGSLPIRMCYDGYGVTDPYANRAPYCVTGQIAVTPFAHSMELGHQADYYSSLSNYGFTENDRMETCYFRGMILRDLQVLRFAKLYFGAEGVLDGNGESVAGQNLWNGELSVSGGSQGAFRALAAAALDHDVTFVDVSIPWMCDIEGQSTESDAMGSYFRPQYTSVLAYFDSISFAKRIPGTARVTISMGLGDYVCPPSGVFTLYNQLECPVTMTVVQGKKHDYVPPDPYMEEIGRP